MEEFHPSIQTPEYNKSTQIAFLLDVDGVITNPSEKKVTEPQIFDFLERHLAAGNPVTLNTGRSNEWMIERVINPFVKKIQDKSILKDFFAVGEKGLTWASFNAEGNLIQGVFDHKGKHIEGFDTSVFLDTQTSEHFAHLEREVKHLIDTKYSHSTFYDSTKKAMISTEMHDGYDQHQYSKVQKQFTTELYELLSLEGLEGKFKIDPTTIATDIQIPDAGKHLGARRILDFLTSRNLSLQHFITVGDSSSYLEMADELHYQGKNVEFKYVNPKKPLQVEKPYKITTSQAEFGKGTEEVLRELGQIL